MCYFCCSFTPFIRKKRLFHIINEFGERIKDGGYGIYFHYVGKDICEQKHEPYYYAY